MIRGCRACLYWDNDWCSDIGGHQSGDLGPCPKFCYSLDVGHLESAVREAGLEESYAQRLVAQAGVRVRAGGVYSREDIGEDEIIALAALTEQQRAQAARETLEEAE